MVHFKSHLAICSPCPICSLFFVYLFLPSFVCVSVYCFMVSRSLKHSGCHPGLASIYLKINVNLSKSQSLNMLCLLSVFEKQVIYRSYFDNPKILLANFIFAIILRY